MQALKLAGGDWQADVHAQAGGLIGSLTHRGIDVLRCMPSGSIGPLQAASFPLVPYCNRIARGRFEWAGQHIALPANFVPEPHSLHGLGWQVPWEITHHADFKCAMGHRHPGIGPGPWTGSITSWPWAYEAEQRIRLGHRGCAISLGLTNRSNMVMPAGIGLHPYFRRRPETRLRFASGRVCEVGGDMIPTGRTLAADTFADFRSGALLPAETIDHCFCEWDGIAVIEDDLGSITLTARGAPHMHVYAPAGQEILCLEPVSHLPDALNQDPAGITALPPGCSASLQMWISAEA